MKPFSIPKTIYVRNPDYWRFQAGAGPQVLNLRVPTDARNEGRLGLFNIIVLGIFITTLSMRPSGLVFQNPTAGLDVVPVGGKIRYRSLSSTFPLYA